MLSEFTSISIFIIFSVRISCLPKPCCKNNISKLAPLQSQLARCCAKSHDTYPSDSAHFGCRSDRHGSVHVRQRPVGRLRLVGGLRREDVVGESAADVDAPAQTLNFCYKRNEYVIADYAFFSLFCKRTEQFVQCMAAGR